MTISTESYNSGLYAPNFDTPAAHLPPEKDDPYRIGPEPAQVEAKPAIPLNNELVLNLDFDNDKFEVTPKIFDSPTGRATVALNMLGDEVGQGDLKVDYPGKLAHGKVYVSAKGASVATPMETGVTSMVARRDATLIRGANQVQETVVSQYGNRLTVDAPGDMNDVQVYRSGNTITIDYPGTLRNTVISKVGQNISITHAHTMGQTLIEASGGGFVIHHPDSQKPTRVTDFGNEIQISFPHETGKTKITPQDQADPFADPYNPYMTITPRFDGVADPNAISQSAYEELIG